MELDTGGSVASTNDAALDARRPGINDLSEDRIARVLIIEDDPDIVDLLTLHFGKAGGFSVSSAADGRSGLQQAREQLPDLIVLDLALPRMPGLEICKILKCEPATKNTPTLVLTNNAEVTHGIVP